MRENNGEDVSDLEVQAKTWNKLEKNMKLIGFRGGAAKGRDQSLQEGFDVGYTAGFELGEYIGQTKGILSCPVELTSVKGSKLSKKNADLASDEVCIMCSEGKNDVGENRNESYPNMDEIMFQQQKLSSEIIKVFQVSGSNTNLYLNFSCTQFTNFAICGVILFSLMLHIQSFTFEVLVGVKLYSELNNLFLTGTSGQMWTITKQQPQLKYIVDYLNNAYTI